MSDLPDSFGAVTAQDRFWAKVDKNGPVHPQLGTRCWIWTAAKTPLGYGKLGRGGKYGGWMFAHRYSLELAMGMFWPDYQHLDVDHRCQNPACVRPSHLRPASNKQNSEHRRGAQSNNRSSGVRGVTWDADRNKWRAQIQHNGTMMNIGRFDTLTEATTARRERANEVFTRNDLERLDD